MDARASVISNNLNVMMKNLNALVCSKCKGNLLLINENLCCKQCSIEFSKKKFGFFDFLLNPAKYEIDSTSDEYSNVQETSGIRIYREYIKPFLQKEPTHSVLDVGCGIGKSVSLMVSEGYDAYGVDLPNVSNYWQRIGNNPEHFFCCDAINLPFKDNFFDVVYSLGVIEHIGTITGHCTLSDDYLKTRQEYANEILRITKPNGRILISCPNKSNPIDVQHGPTDQVSPNYKIRNLFYNKTKLNIHPTWGKYHLLSYAEMKKLFCNKNGHSFEPLSLKGYFGFERYERGFNKPFLRLIEMYVNNLPENFRASFLNPYMLVQIRK